MKKLCKVFIVVLLFASASAFATDLGDVATNITSMGNNIGTAVKTIALVVGLAMVVAGFLEIKKANNDHQPISKGIGILAIGVCLASVGAFISIGSSSLKMTPSSAGAFLSN